MGTYSDRTQKTRQKNRLTLSIGDIFHFLFDKKTTKKISKKNIY
jgi:hypothetical protein